MKLFKRSVLVFVALVTMMLACTVHVHAATLKQLTRGKTYKSFDFTGDGRKDTIKYTQKGSSGYYTGLTVSMNGKSQSFGYVQCGVFVFKYTNKKVYLVVNHHSGGYGTGVDVYRYVGGRFINAAYDIGLGSTNSVHVYKANGNQLWLKAGIRKPHQSLSFKQVYNRLPTWIEKFKVNTSKNKLVYASKYANFTGQKYFKYCGWNTLRTNSGPNSSDGKGVSVTYGKKVQFLQAYIKTRVEYYNGKKYTYYSHAYKIKYNGKTGWFDESVNYPFTDA